MPKGEPLTEDGILAVLEGLVSGKITAERVNLSDTEQTGLRVIVRKTGAVTYHAHYEVDGRRPLTKIGAYPGMRLESARALVRTIRHFAERDVDPFGDLYESRIQELLTSGTTWQHTHQSGN
jgi:hypothetical protein